MNPSSPAVPPVVPPFQAPEPYEATRLRNGTGAVQKGALLTEADAVLRRQSGDDVVVCGSNSMANYRLASQIEFQVGPAMDDKAHTRTAGAQALRHFHQVSRNPAGHTFYEQPPTRKAV